MPHINPTQTVLSATENPITCRIFTLSAGIIGATGGNVTPTPVDMDIQITGNGKGATHQYELEVTNGPLRHTMATSLEFEWKDAPGWTPNGIIRPMSAQASSPSPTIQTNASPLFQAHLKKTQGGQLGLQPITVNWKHGNVSPQCVHTVILAVQVI